MRLVYFQASSKDIQEVEEFCKQNNQYHIDDSLISSVNQPEVIFVSKDVTTDKIIGVISAVSIHANCLHVLDLFVLEQYRDNDISLKLLELLNLYAQCNKYGFLEFSFIEKDEPVYKFYSIFGFEDTKMTILRDIIN